MPCHDGLSCRQLVAQRGQPTRWWRVGGEHARDVCKGQAVIAGTALGCVVALITRMAMVLRHILPRPWLALEMALQLGQVPQLMPQRPLLCKQQEQGQQAGQEQACHGVSLARRSPGARQVRWRGRKGKRGACYHDGLGLKPSASDKR